MNRNNKTGNTLNKEHLQARMAENLDKTFDLIELHQGLKLALYKKLYPGKSDEELTGLICDANLKRKQAAWKPQTI